MTLHLWDWLKALAMVLHAVAWIVAQIVAIRGAEIEPGLLMPVIGVCVMIGLYATTHGLEHMVPHPEVKIALVGSCLPVYLFMTRGVWWPLVLLWATLALWRVARRLSERDA